MNTNFLDRILIALGLILSVYTTSFSQEITTNIGFDVLAGVPIDQRTVINTLADTSTIDWPYEGLYTHVKDIDEYWRYTGSQWELFQISGLNNSYISNDTLYIIATDSTYSLLLSQYRQYIDSLELQGDTMLRISLSDDGVPMKELDLSALNVTPTLAEVSSFSDDAAKSTYSMSAGVPVEFKSSDNNTLLYLDEANERVGIGQTSPSYILDINSTDAVRLPVGTTAQRPTGADGLLRYNSDSTAFTGYYNAQWNRLVDHSFLYSSTARSAVNYWKKNGDLLNYGVNNAGRVGIGVNLTSIYKFGVTARSTDGFSHGTYSVFNLTPGSGYAEGTGMQSSVNYTPTASGSSGYAKGGVFSSIHSGSFPGLSLLGGEFAVNSASSSTLNSAIAGRFLTDVNNTSSTTNAIGGFFGLRANGTTSITNYTGLQVGVYATRQNSTIGTLKGIEVFDHAGTSGTNSIVTQYGLYIHPQISGTTNYAIYSAGGQSYHSGKLGLGVTTPTAKLHIAAGTATASTAPLKFTSGTNLTTPEAGAMEWDGDRLYITQTSGPTRKTIAYADDMTAEANDLTSAVVWANVPDVNITSSSVTQHEGDLTIDDITTNEIAYGTGGGITSTSNFSLNTNGVLNSYTSVGIFNTGIGFNTLGALDAASRDVVIVGNNAMNNIIADADRNVGIGNYVLNGITTGDDNTAGGNRAGSNKTTSESMTVLGSNAGSLNSLNTGGSYITALGYGAGRGMRDDLFVALGYRALDNTSDVFYSLGTVAIGQNAFRDLTIDQDYSIAIGSGAGYNQGTYDKAILIGADVQPDRNNQIVIGHAKSGYESTQLKSRNYRWNIDQTLGASQDGYVMTYNNTSGELELQAGSVTDGNGIFDAANDDGTIPATFEARLTDILYFSNSSGNEFMTLNGTTQQVGIGTSPSTGYGLSVGKSITATSGTFGDLALGSALSAPSTSSVTFNGLVSAPTISGTNNFTGDISAAVLYPYNASSGTISNLFGLKITPITTGGTITNMKSLYIQPNRIVNGTVTNVTNIELGLSGTGYTNYSGIKVLNTTAATNVKGITLEVERATNKYNIYASGGADNYFNGDVGIYDSSPDYNLDVNGTLGVLGTVTFEGYGSGYREAEDRSKTKSGYIAIFATDGTLLEEEFTNPYGGESSLAGILDSLYANQGSSAPSGELLYGSGTSTTSSDKLIFDGTTLTVGVPANNSDGALTVGNYSTSSQYSQNVNLGGTQYFETAQKASPVSNTDFTALFLSTWKHDGSSSWPFGLLPLKKGDHLGTIAFGGTDSTGTVKRPIWLMATADAVTSGRVDGTFGVYTLPTALGVTSVDTTNNAIMKMYSKDLSTHFYGDVTAANASTEDHIITPDATGALSQRVGGTGDLYSVTINQEEVVNNWREFKFSQTPEATLTVGSSYITANAALEESGIKLYGSGQFLLAGEDTTGQAYGKTYMWPSRIYQQNYVEHGKVRIDSVSRNSAYVPGITRWVHNRFDPFNVPMPDSSVLVANYTVERRAEGNVNTYFDYIWKEAEADVRYRWGFDRTLGTTEHQKLYQNNPTFEIALHQNFVRIDGVKNTIDSSGVETPINFLYTDETGKVLSGGIGALSGISFLAEDVSSSTISPATLKVITGETIGSDYAINARTSGDSLILKFFPAGLLPMSGSIADAAADQLMIIDVSESPDKAKRLTIQNMLGGSTAKTTPANAATVDFDANGLMGGKIQVNMTNVTTGITLSFSNMVDGGDYLIYFTNVTGTDTLTLPSGCINLQGDGSTVSSIDITENTYYYITYDGTNYYFR